MGHLFGVDASNGDILWKVKHDQSSDPDMRRYELIKCTTPLYNKGMVYVTGGYDTGGMMVRIADNGNDAYQLFGRIAFWIITMEGLYL